MTYSSLKNIFHKKFLENAFFIYVIQFSSYALPLLSIPYLSRTLGLERFGILMIGQSVSSLGMIIIDYGFSFSASREIANNQDNREELKKIVSNVQCAKLILCGIVFALYILLFFSNYLLASYPEIVFLSALLSCSQGFSPYWYFLGIQKLKEFTVIDTVFRIISVASLFFFISSPYHVWRIFIISIIAQTSSTTLTTILMIKSTGIIKISLDNIIETLKINFSMFLFKLFATFYTSANALILGFFLPPSSVSAFGGAEKITKTFIGLFTPIFQALFPFINRMARKDIGKTRILINFVLLVVSSVTVLISIFVYINAERIIYLFLGIEFKDSVTLLRLMILLCPIISISSVLGIQWMLPLRLDKKFNDIIIPSAVFSLIMSFVMVPKYGNIAMVLILIFTELTISIRMLSFYYNVNNIN